MMRPPRRPRAVFDSNTFIQAVAFESGPAAACLRLVELGQAELYVSKAMMAELRRVLSYTEVLEISEAITPV